MSTTFTVNGVPYIFPTEGTNPNWGEEVTVWGEAVTNLLATLSGDDDISRTTFTIANNQSTASNVNGLFFSTGTVRSGFITYSIYRLAEDGSGNTEKSEAGIIRVMYNGDTGTWDLGQEFNGDGGVTFTITPAGQLQYTSTNLTAGTSYTGEMTFQAVAFTQ